MAYFTVSQAGDAYPAIGARYFRRLVDERRIPFHRVGRKILLCDLDIEALIGSGREEPMR